jgi:uncharacterized membrane protein required for colicin V production
MNVVDIVIVLIIILEAMLGLRIGFVWGIFDLVMIAVGVLAGAVGYPVVAGPLGRLLDTEGTAVNVLAFVIVALVVQSVLSLLIRLPLLPLSALIRTLAPARWLDSALGLLPGIVKGVLLATVLVVAVLVLPVDPRIGNALDQSRLGQQLLTGASEITYQLQDRIGLDLADFVVTASPESEAARQLPFTVSVGLTVSEDAESEMLALVNQARVTHGLSPLSPDTGLQRAARNHSREMFELAYFSHDSQAAGIVGDRLRAASVHYAIAGGTVPMPQTWRLRSRA